MISLIIKYCTSDVLVVEIAKSENSMTLHRCVRKSSLQFQTKAHILLLWRRACTTNNNNHLTTSTSSDSPKIIIMPPRSLSNCSQSISIYTINDEVSCESNEVLRSATQTMKRKGSKPLTRAVRFTDRNTTFPIPHLDDISDAEVAEIWYNAAEYSEIKSAYQLTIFMMENGELKEGDDFTSRGLEYRTQQGAWARYENKRDAYNAVLDEQDRQWKADKDDHDALGRVYLQHSSKCAVAAAERGADDAKEAKEICQDILKRRKVRRKKSKVEDEAAPMADSTPRVERVRQMLREQSFSRRGEIREDIEKQQAKALKKDKRQALAV